MNKLEQLNRALLPVLDLVKIKSTEYLIIGSAAEFISGFCKSFNDVDIIVSKDVFNRLIDDMFRYELITFAGKNVRRIRVGSVDIIEHYGDWLDRPKHLVTNLPVLGTEDLIEWRIETGRTKDQLRAWQIIHQIYADARPIVLSNPPLAALPGLLEIESKIFKYQQQLMEMAN